MIHKGNCIICNKEIKVNGEYNFNFEIKRHFFKEHPKETIEYQNFKELAEKDLKKWKENYGHRFFISLGGVNSKDNNFVNKTEMK